MRSDADSCRILDLPKIENPAGSLTFIEGKVHIPFSIERVYYLYDVPGGSKRGGHGHKHLQQVVIAMSGSFDVHVDDGRDVQVFHLNRSYYGLYIPHRRWREIDNFSSGAVCMVLASEKYDECDYIRNYEEFVSYVSNVDAAARK